MRVFVIDVNAGTYYTDDIKDDLETYYKIIGCKLIDIVDLKIEDRVFDVICDDEGLSAEFGARPSVVDMKSGVRMIGSLIFCHANENGDEVGLNDGDAAVLNKYMVFSESTEDGSVRRNRNPRYPVVSLVLYFGERPWVKPMRLLDVLEIPAALENIVNDYKIRVLDLRRFERSVVDQFKSDFWIVADYFWQVQNTDGYKPSEETIVHIDEILDFFRYALRDDRFTMNYLVQDGEEVPRNMCEVMDRAVNQGRIEGRKEGKIDTLVDLVKRGLLSIDDAAKTADISADAFRKLLAN